MKYNNETDVASTNKANINSSGRESRIFTFCIYVCFSVHPTK